MISMNKVEKSKKSWGECKKTIKHKWHIPFVFVEWICWRIKPFLEQLAFLKVLEHLGRLAILFAVISYFWGGNERRMQVENQRKAKHFQAWQLINASQGNSSSGGRIDALQDLANDNVSLAGVDLSNAYLTRIDLKKGTSLYEANLTRANIFEANLEGVYFADANCTETFFAGTNLRGTDFRGANLKGAILTGVEFNWVDLRDSNLKDVKDWQKIKNIEFTNVYGIKNAPKGFVEWAKEHGAVSIESTEEWKKLILPYLSMLN